jgi:large subunit ribosomal protein L10
MKSQKTYRPEKEAIVEEFRRIVSGSPLAILVENRGLTVDRMAELRRRLRPERARLRVAPNRLLLHAARNTPAEALKPLLRGPTALVVGDGDPVETARVVVQFGKETQMLAAKGGVLEGRPLTAEDMQALAALPSKSVLQGQLVGVLASPLRGLVGTLQAKVASLLYVLKAVEQKKAGSAAAA